MATFEKRGDYQWRAKVRIKGFPSQSKTFDTKSDAESWAKVVESEMVRGVWVSHSEAEKTTLRELLRRYQDEILPTKKSQRPVIYQMKAINHHIGDYFLASLTSSKIASYRDQRLKEVDPQTVRKDLSLIQRVINIAMKEWGIALPQGNPVLQIKMPKQPEGRDRRLQDGEEQKISLELSENILMHSVFLFAIETGMRRGEIVSMRWEDVDFNVCVVKIPQTKTDVSRKIPLSSKASEILMALPRRIDQRVWSIKPDSITQAFDRACVRANIQNLRFHDLRHEATSRFFERGLNIIEVATITGHKDLKMLKRYTHLRAEDLAKKLG
ncbi:site-specific integrase [Methylomonas fluvii]|uniref:Site-specific integrase n=1 Tax=Methylomonas fluvii TaxID=1854564 RepID=A0ABR9DBK6_9GAMM|nr:site-specific integrase [Methylomonas fluvii]MBD9360492.1 site-specific integrase [Methylomonas fluvii]CAD6873311.1 Shufflon-specific DNA recombinase [Methylomonas fluvii]